jgi:CHAT domain-containing protein
VGERAAALPAVAAELATIAETWPGPCDQLLGSQASRAALLARSAGGDLAGYGLLHIASHAQLLSSRGLAAHVKLWDGDLLLPEVVGLRLDGALVTLSVCRGAATDVLPGEEILSLSWAFLAAGARGVMASVWPIPDQAAFRFMSQFYAALRHSRDAALALTIVQRAFISAHRSDDDPLGQPLYWSNFVFTG